MRTGTLHVVLLIGAFRNCECFGIAFSSKVSHQRLTRVRSSHFLVRGGHHSFVEGSENEYLDQAAEIESMGGDPFFLIDDNDDGHSDGNGRRESENDKGPNDALSLADFAGFNPALNVEVPKEEKPKYYATDGTGPAPKNLPQNDAANDDDWEWDGVVVEDAHMDLW